MRLGGNITILMLACGWAHASDWPQFRGPDGTGFVESLSHPLEWSDTANLAWKVPIPGAGWSSPLVVGDRIYVTTASGEGYGKPLNMSAGARDRRSMPLFGDKTPPKEAMRFELLCLSLADGKTVWSRTVAESPPKIPVHPSNTFATETPVSDSNRICVFFGAAGTLVAFDLEGNRLWARDFDVEPIQNGLGTGASLALAGELVVLQRDNETRSRLHAIRMDTGEETWAVDRPKGTGWSTPLVWKTTGRTEVVSCGPGLVAAYEPATGKELWRFEDFKSSFSSSPAATPELLVFGTSGPFGSFPLYAMRPQQSGTISLGDEAPGRLAWNTPKVSLGMSSPVIANGNVFVGGDGILKVYDAETGEPRFQKRLTDAKIFVASAWANDKHVFLLDESGATFVLKAGKDYELLHVNRLEDTFWSTPAAAGGSLLLRSVGHLYCVRSPQPR